MDPYDSDSSVDEDFAETNVLLGYADEEVIEDTISHLGGWPVCSQLQARSNARTCTLTSPVFRSYSHGSMRIPRHQATTPTAKSAIAPCYCFSNCTATCPTISPITSAACTYLDVPGNHAIASQGVSGHIAQLARSVFPAYHCHSRRRRKRRSSPSPSPSPR